MRTVSPIANGGRRRVCSQRVIPSLVLYAHCVTHCQRGQATCVLTAGDSRSGSVCALCHPLPTVGGRRVCSQRVIPGLVLYAHCVTHCQRGQFLCRSHVSVAKCGFTCIKGFAPRAMWLVPARQDGDHALDWATEDTLGR